MEYKGVSTCNGFFCQLYENCLRRKYYLEVKKLNDNNNYHQIPPDYNDKTNLCENQIKLK